MEKGGGGCKSDRGPRAIQQLRGRNFAPLHLRTGEDFADPPPPLSVHLVVEWHLGRDMAREKDDNKGEQGRWGEIERVKVATACYAILRKGRGGRKDFKKFISLCYRMEGRGKARGS